MTSKRMIAYHKDCIKQAEKYKSLVIKHPETIDTRQKSLAAWIKYYENNIRQHKAALKKLNANTRLSARVGSNKVSTLYAWIAIVLIIGMGSIFFIPQEEISGLSVNTQENSIDLNSNWKTTTSSLEHNISDLKVFEKAITDKAKFKSKIKKSTDQREVYELPGDIISIGISVIKNGLQISLDNTANLVYDGKLMSIKNFNKVRAKELKAGNMDNNASIYIIVQGTIGRGELIFEYVKNDPKVEELDISETKKQVVISSADHYQNLTARSLVPIPVKKNLIKLFWIQNGTNVPVEIDEYYDTNSDGLIEEIKWHVPHLSTQVFEIQIDVLNIQSYPVVGGKWNVEFTTVGKSDLIIEAFNGTTWSAADTGTDLNFVNLTCDGQEVNYTWSGSKVIVYDYECNGTSVESSKVLTSGKHNLAFGFGNETEYAFNDANNIPVIDNISLTSTSGIDVTTDNLTVEINSSDANSDPVKHIIDWRKDGTSIASINMPFEANESLMDYSTFGNNGTNQNAIFHNTSGYDGFGAMEFDGSSAMINISQFDDRLKAAGFWFKPAQEYNSTSADAVLMATNYSLLEIKDGYLRLTYNNDTINSSQDTWLQNVWYHVFFMHDGRNISLYVDNIKVDGMNASALFVVQNDTVDVASFYANGDLVLSGSCFAQSSCGSPDADAFIVMNSIDNVAYINSTGNMCIIDSNCNDYDVSCDAPSGDSFVVKDESGTNVAYIDEQGSLCLIGGLYENN